MIQHISITTKSGRRTGAETDMSGKNLWKRKSGERVVAVKPANTTTTSVILPGEHWRLAF